MINEQSEGHRSGDLKAFRNHQDGEGVADETK